MHRWWSSEIPAGQVNKVTFVGEIELIIIKSILRLGRRNWDNTSFMNVRVIVDRVQLVDTINVKDNVDSMEVQSNALGIVPGIQRTNIDRTIEFNIGNNNNNCCCCLEDELSNLRRAFMLKTMPNAQPTDPFH